MSWWLIPSIIGVIAAAIALGLLISYFILKRQNRPWPFSHKSASIRVKGGTTDVPAAANPIDGTAEGKTKGSSALIELEGNLEIATGPATNGLVKFQMEVWNTRRSEFDILDSALLGELTEAYVDMILANNIVCMTTEPGQSSQNLTDNYAKLSNKVAERLKRIMPDIREKF